jgi:hypothetical protein
MSHRLIGPAAAIISLSLALAGCELIPKDLVGTWTRDEGGNILTVVFERKTISLSQTNPAGSISFAVDAADDHTRHIDTTVTGSTGEFWPGYAIGAAYYWTYELKSDGLYFMFSPVTYPPTASSGPYTPVP